MLRVLPPAFEPALQPFFMCGKTRNSHTQLVLQQCCTLHVSFVVVRFTAPLKPLIVSYVKEAGGRNLLSVYFFVFLYPKILQAYETFDEVIPGDV